MRSDRTLLNLVCSHVLPFLFFRFFGRNDLPELFKKKEKNETSTNTRSERTRAREREREGRLARAMMANKKKGNDFSLYLSQRAESLSLQVTLVDENLLAPVVGDDEPKPFCRVEPFDCVQKRERAGERACVRKDKTIRNRENRQSPRWQLLVPKKKKKQKKNGSLGALRRNRSTFARRGRRPHPFPFFSTCLCFSCCSQTTMICARLEVRFLSFFSFSEREFLIAF